MTADLGRPRSGSGPGRCLPGEGSGAGALTRDTHLLGTFIYSLWKGISMAGAMATITPVLTVFCIRRMLREEA